MFTGNAQVTPRIAPPTCGLSDAQLGIRAASRRSEADNQLEHEVVPAAGSVCPMFALTLPKQQGRPVNAAPFEDARGQRSGLNRIAEARARAMSSILSQIVCRRARVHQSCRQEALAEPVHLAP